MPDQVTPLAPVAPPAPVQEPQVPVWDNKADEERFVPASQAEAGIASGIYTRQANTVVTNTAANNQPIVREPIAGTAAAQLGERQASNLEAAHKADASTRLHSFDGILTGLEVAADSFVDSLSFGALHERGEVAELKHQAHPGAEFTGSMLAFALPTEGALGALKNASPLGKAEKAISSVAGKLVPQAESTLGRVVSGAGREAISNAALIAGYDTTHQAVDALVDDKPFSGEHVAAQIPLGLLLGGVFGAAGEYVNKFAENEATAKALRGQDGIVNPKSTASAQAHAELTGAVQEWDQVIQHRSAQARLMRELVDSGSLKDVPQAYMDRVEAAQDAAVRARKALERVDMVGAMSEGSPAEMSRAAQAVRAYESAANAFDTALRPSEGELGLTAPAKAGELGAPQAGPAYEHQVTGHGGPVMDQAAFDLDARMSDPELRQRYNEIYGKDYEFMPGNSPEELAQQGKASGQIEDKGYADMGGEVTPTSENLTNVGKKRGVAAETPREPDLAPAEAESMQTRPEPPRPETPPAIVEKLEGGKKARLENGDVVWRSEHRKMLKDYDRQLADWEAAKKAAPEAPAAPGPTTKVLPRPAGGLADLNQAVEQLGGHVPTTKVMPASERPLEPRSSKALTLHDESPLGAQVGMQDPGIKGPIAPLRPVRSEPYARQWLENLAREHGPIVSPGMKAEARIDTHLQNLEVATGGKLTAARALEVAESLGVKGQHSRLSDRMVQLWAVRRLAETAADAAHGVKRGPANKLIRKLAANGVAAVGLKHMGATGFVLGHALGWAANAGAVAGKAKLAVKEVAQMLLKNKRSAILARTFTQNHDKRERDNASEHYGFQSPALQERAHQITRAVADEDVTRQRIRESLGDVAAKSPDLASQIVDSTMMRLQNLSRRLPAFAARTGHVSVQDQRRFDVYEDATWHPEVILEAVGTGDLTPTLASALMEQHPQLQRVLTEELMANPATVQQLPNRLLRQVEMITGMPLSRASDPGFLMRQQMHSPTSAQAATPGAPQGGSGPSQRFKISAPPPLPSQAAGLNGRAPGN